MDLSGNTRKMASDGGIVLIEGCEGDFCLLKYIALAEASDKILFYFSKNPSDANPHLDYLIVMGR